MRFLRQAGSFANSDMLRPNADSNSANERYVSSASGSSAPYEFDAAMAWSCLSVYSRSAEPIGSVSSSSSSSASRISAISPA